MMADGDAAFDEGAWQAQLVATLERAVLKKYQITLRRPIIMRRARMDAPARLVLPPLPGPPQIWMRTSDSEAERQAAFIQALAGVAAQQLPAAGESEIGLGSQRWSLIVKFLRGDEQAPCLVEQGLPPDLPLASTVVNDAASGKELDCAATGALPADDVAKHKPKKRASRPTVEWVSGKGTRVDLPGGVVGNRPIDEALARDASVGGLRKLFVPRPRIWWMVSSAGPVAAVDIDQVAAKNYASSLRDDTDYGSVKYPLRKMVRDTQAVKSSVTSDVVLLFGYPSKAPSATLVAAAGLWRICRRVGDQLQYQVQMPFVWSDLEGRGVFRKALVETVARVLAHDLDEVAATQHGHQKLGTVVARLLGEPIIDTCYKTMTSIHERFDTLCKKRRGGVPFGGVDNGVIVPPLLAASRRK